MNKRSIYFFIFIFNYCFFYSQIKEVFLNSSWQFKQKSSQTYYNAIVPGNVFNDLFSNKLIPDPFYSDNEKKVQWVENEDWEYKTYFTCDSSILKNKCIELVFDGLDTYASVFLNDSLILQANNMFRSWKIDVKSQLHVGDNTLRVFFESPVNKGKMEAKQLSYTLPEGERVFTRKAQFQYGWDFGPRFVGCGIWKPIKLIAWSGPKINSWHYLVKSISDSLASVDVVIETLSDTVGLFKYNINQLSDHLIKNQFINYSKSIVLKKGINVDTLTLKIKKPKLWWSNGLGDPYLYQLSCKLINSNKIISTVKMPIGIRTIELINLPDSIGTSFYFKLNNVPVFMKGANYIPSDIFLKQKTKLDLLNDLTLYKNSHFNMLRIWGGGVYGDDDFYQTCDENGILVWQDFMFACAMYPGDVKFINNVREEIKEQVIRLRNHPSLALWCGNNEINEAWFNWGWQKQFNYTKADSSVIWNDYQKLFHSIIPKYINDFNKQTPYCNSSPFIGWGHAESLKQGDSHYWGVWWGMEPFDVYQKKVGRFMSEYGFQSLPNVSTFKTFCDSSQLNLNSISVKAHQKHKTGFETIQTYLDNSYKTPQNFQDYIYVSQLVQRDGMKKAIEAHRINKPRCMGTLFWQLNDCWPGSSWSAIDYFGQPNAVFYSLKKLFNTQLVSISEQQDYYKISCLSDSLKDFKVTLNLKILNFKSELIWQKSFSKELNNSYVNHTIISKKELPLFDSTSSYFKAEIVQNQKIMATTNYLFSQPKKTNLKKAEIVIKKINSNTFQISANEFIKDLYLYDQNQNVILDDNYFDLDYGKIKLVKVIQSQKTKTSINLKAISLNNL